MFQLLRLPQWVLIIFLLIMGIIWIMIYNPKEFDKGISKIGEIINDIIQWIERQ